MNNSQMSQMSNTNYSTVHITSDRTVSTSRQLTHTETSTANTVLNISYSDQARDSQPFQNQNTPDTVHQTLADIGRLTDVGRDVQTLTENTRTPHRHPHMADVLTASQPNENQAISSNSDTQLRLQPRNSETTSREGNISSDNRKMIQLSTEIQV